MKTCLPDINVWIAVVSDRHVHHVPAVKWFDLIEPGGAAFCRITQIGFLRLITNRHVMGADMVAQKEAWQIYEQLARDHRICFLQEPSDIENKWRRLTQGNTAATNLWTDAYLCAFAAASHLQVVSFDNGMRGDNSTILNK